MQRLVKTLVVPACLAIPVLGAGDGLWFGTSSGQAVAGDAAAARPVAQLRPTKLSAGVSHTCAITDAGGLKCWGWNARGQIGDGTLTDRLKPVTPVTLSRGVTSVSAGLGHTCALLAAGAIDCWGYGGVGQLGDGQATDRYLPGPVPAIGNNGLDVAAGGLHTCAIVKGNTVKCWGSNDYGQLGNGTTIQSDVPVNVNGLPAGIVALSTGRYHSCALSSKGRVFCWGYNDDGQLGDGTTTQKLTAVPVAKLDTVTAISASFDYHTCALKDDGSMWCWGDNTYGQIGDGTKLDRLKPVRVFGLSSGVKAISTGNGHTCAVMKSGRMKCWGNNEHGELGTGTFVQFSAVPVNVVGRSADDVSAGGEHSCARTTRDALVCWGYNANGQLGNNSATTAHIPVNVKGF